MRVTGGLQQVINVAKPRKPSCSEKPGAYSKLDAEGPIQGVLCGMLDVAVFTVLVT